MWCAEHCGPDRSLLTARTGGEALSRGDLQRPSGRSGARAQHAYRKLSDELDNAWRTIDRRARWRIAAIQHPFRRDRREAITQQEQYKCRRGSLPQCGLWLDKYICPAARRGLGARIGEELHAAELWDDRWVSGGARGPAACHAVSAACPSCCRSSQRDGGRPGAASSVVGAAEPSTEEPV